MPDINELKHGDSNAWGWFHRLGGVASMSNYYVFHIFSQIMDDKNVQRIIEIGTAYGGMTVGLALEAARRDIPIHTFDIEDMPTPETNRIFYKLNVCRVRCDVFEKFPKTLFNEPCYLLCDGGDKRRELETFAPQLKSGSYVSVHDYGTEIFDRDLEFMYGIAEPFNKEDWTRHNSQLCTFKIK